MRATELIGSIAIRKAPCIYKNGVKDYSYTDAKVFILAATDLSIEYTLENGALCGGTYCLTNDWCDNNWEKCETTSIDFARIMGKVKLQKEKTKMLTSLGFIEPQYRLSGESFALNYDSIWVGGLENTMRINPEEIIDVIHNDPATIIKWKNGTKTVVKCQPGDKYNKESGFAMAICKKAFGNKGNYNEVFKKWCE